MTSTPLLARAATLAALSLSLSPAHLPVSLAAPAAATTLAAPEIARSLAAGLQLEAAGLAAARQAPDAAFTATFDGGFLRGPRPQAQAVDAGGSGERADATAGLSGTQLLKALHDLTGRGFIAHEYDAARRYMFGVSDQVTVNGQTGLIDAYSGVFVPGSGGDGSTYRERGDQNGDGREDIHGMNAEHIWPQSFFDQKNPMRSDLHHLMTTFVYPNGARGSLPFGEVRGRGEYNNRAGAKSGQGVFEPPKEVKGRVARAMLYFYVRYHDKNISNRGYSEKFWNDKIEMLLRWNRDYPPTDQEKQRNELVYRFQGNRNPFVDDPALADRIGAAALRRDRSLRAPNARYPRSKRRAFRR